MWNQSVYWVPIATQTFQKFWSYCFWKIFSFRASNSFSFPEFEKPGCCYSLFRTFASFLILFILVALYFYSICSSICFFSFFQSRENQYLCSQVFFSFEVLHVFSSTYFYFWSALASYLQRFSCIYHVVRKSLVVSERIIFQVSTLSTSICLRHVSSVSPILSD